MTALLLALALPCLTAFALISLLWGDARLRSQAALKAALAVGIGIGLSSLTGFAALLSIGSGAGPCLALDLPTLLIVAAVAAHAFKARRLTLDGAAGPQERASREALPYVGLLLMLALAARVLLTRTHELPHGDWDAWWIWNLRARAIFRGGEHWADAFSPAYLSNSLGGHLDYPLLLPLAVARCWSYVGGDPTFVPVVLAGLFTLGTAALLFSGVAAAAGTPRALLAALALLATPTFLLKGAGQCADVPLAFFILATIVLLWNGEKGSRAPLALAGLTAGLAAWTKNEGVLFLAAVVMGRLAAAWRARDWRSLRAEAGPFAIGLLPGLAALVYFKAIYAPPNDLLSGSAATLVQFLLPERHGQVLSDFAIWLYGFGEWHRLKPLPVNPWPLLLGWGFYAGARPEVARTRWFTTVLCTLALMLLGYYAAYILTPHNVEWQVSTSLTRLLLQLWPTVLFLFFVSTARAGTEPAAA